MAINISGFHFYLDANLTIPLQSDLLSIQKDDGSSPPTEFQLWFGSPLTTTNAQAASSPGVAQIDLTVQDTAPGGGHQAAEIKLALTQGGLAAATPGATLSIGTEVTGGAGNGIEFWIEVDDATMTAGFGNELSVETNQIIPVQP